MPLGQLFFLIAVVAAILLVFLLIWNHGECVPMR